MSKSSKQEIQDYVVVLKNNNKKMVEQTGWLFSLFAMILFCFSLYQDPKNTSTWLFTGLTFAMAVTNGIKKKQHRKVQFYPLLVIAGIGIMLSTDMPFIGIFLLIGAFMERRTGVTKEIGFSDTGIEFNYKRKRKISWPELSNVILRDDLLTIDLKNNSIIQIEVDDEDDADYEVGEDEFNAYCRAQLGKP